MLPPDLIPAGLRRRRQVTLPPGPVPAGLGRRIVGYLTDQILVYGLVGTAEFIAYLVASDAGDSFDLQGAVRWAGLGVYFGYFILFWAVRGQTPGQMLVAIHVVRRGHPAPGGIGYNRAVRRAFGYYICWFTLGIGFIFRLHDRIADTDAVCLAPAHATPGARGTIRAVPHREHVANHRALSIPSRVAAYPTPLAADSRARRKVVAELLVSMVAFVVVLGFYASSPSSRTSARTPTPTPRPEPAAIAPAARPTATATRGIVTAPTVTPTPTPRVTPTARVAAREPRTPPADTRVFARWKDMPIPLGTEVRETGDDTAEAVVTMGYEDTKEWFYIVLPSESFRRGARGDTSRGFEVNWVKGDYIYTCVLPRATGADDRETTVYLERARR